MRKKEKSLYGAAESLKIKVFNFLRRARTLKTDKADLIQKEKIQRRDY